MLITDVGLCADRPTYDAQQDVSPSRKRTVNSRKMSTRACRWKWIRSIPEIRDVGNAFYVGGDLERNPVVVGRASRLTRWKQRGQSRRPGQYTILNSRVVRNVCTILRSVKYKSMFDAWGHDNACSRSFSDVISTKHTIFERVSGFHIACSFVRGCEVDYRCHSRRRPTFLF